MEDIYQWAPEYDKLYAHGNIAYDSTSYKKHNLSQIEIQAIRSYFIKDMSIAYESTSYKKHNLSQIEIQAICSCESNLLRLQSLVS